MEVTNGVEGGVRGYPLQAQSSRMEVTHGVEGDVRGCPLQAQTTRMEYTYGDQGWEVTLAEFLPAGVQNSPSPRMRGDSVAGHTLDGMGGRGWDCWTHTGMEWGRDWIAGWDWDCWTKTGRGGREGNDPSTVPTPSKIVDPLLITTTCLHNTSILGMGSKRRPTSRFCRQAKSRFMCKSLSPAVCRQVTTPVPLLPEQFAGNLGLTTLAQGVTNTVHNGCPNARSQQALPGVQAAPIHSHSSPPSQKAAQLCVSTVVGSNQCFKGFVVTAATFGLFFPIVMLNAAASGWPARLCLALAV
eukprot:1156699-Pelagomonas_calceolata.AAC.1